MLFVTYNSICSATWPATFRFPALTDSLFARRKDVTDTAPYTMRGAIAAVAMSRTKRDVMRLIAIRMLALPRDATATHC